MQNVLTRRAIENERATDAEELPSTVDSDADLVSRAHLDRQAFAALYDRYLDPVYRYSYIRLDNRESAEDATSLIFTKALDNIATHRGPSFRAWLFTIAHNVVTDLYHARRVTESLDAAVEIADSALAPDDLAADHDLGRAIREALRHLTPDQRDVVELRLAGLTGPEIARAIGKSHAAVRIAQFRGYAKLRTLLGETWKEANDVA